MHGETVKFKSQYVPFNGGNIMALLTCLWIICKSCNIPKFDSNGLDLFIKIEETNIIKKEKIKKNIGPVKENGVWMIHTNQGLMGLSIEPDIITEIRKGRLR